MRVDTLTIREIRLRLKAPFETSFGTVRDRRVLLVEVQCDSGTGWGEITALEQPFYNGEATDTAWVAFCEYVAPLVAGKDLADPAEIPTILNPVRGHEMTKAAVENALWDVRAQETGVSLPTLLGGTRKQIDCGVSLGIQSSETALIASIEQELAAGYLRIKIKIKPGKDLDFIAAARRHFPETPLMADANSAYDLNDAAHLKRFDDYALMMIEQPLRWDDIYEHSLLQSRLRTPICLDECIHNLSHARAAIDLRACQILNLKLGRVGGHSEAKRIEEFCRKRAVPVWCGGMLESGVGRAHNIAMASLPGFVLPGDVSASQRYWDEDIVDPEIEVTPQGTIEVRDVPGLGYRVRSERVDRLTGRRQTVPANPRPAVTVLN